MTTEKVVVTAPNGLHARPVGEIVRIAKSFPDSAVTITSGEKIVKATSMLSILSLGLKKGTEVEIRAEGGDEAGAVNAIVNLIQSVTE